MKFKKLLTLLLTAVLGVALGACSNDAVNLGELVVWVGTESAAFYQTALDTYVENYNASHEEAFPGTIAVYGVDTGSSADNYLVDTTKGGDLFICAHDNLGKLLEGSGTIEKVNSKDLINQITANSPEDFLNVCYLAAGDGSNAAFYGVPIISQSLVLYYDKALFEGKEDKLASWEGIAEVASAEGKNATAYLGSDGYNYSHWLLAQPESDDAIAAFKEKGTLQVYGAGLAQNCYAWGDDQVAIAKYAQRFTSTYMANKVVSDDGWEKDLGAVPSKIATVIGGAWSLARIINYLGEDGYGVTVLPTFTLTDADAYGTAKAGMVFRSGSFFDAKVMCKKKGSAFADYLDDILLYLSSNEIQQQSYIQCANLPASKNIDLGSNELANAQYRQAELASIPQPFGYGTSYNGAYYSKGAPDIYVAISQGMEGYTTDEGIVKGLQTMSYIWAKNKKPSGDEKLAEWVASTNK